MSRFSVLLSAMALLGIIRVAFPPQPVDLEVVSAVVNRPAAPVSVLAPAPSAASAPSIGVPAPEDDRPGNAFNIRTIAPPATSAAPISAPVAIAPIPLTAPASTAVVENAPPPPPLQVIGTYDDGSTPAVFVSTPLGTLIARSGSTLMAEYRVTAITAQHVAVTQLSTQRTYQLAMPGAVP